MERKKATLPDQVDHLGEMDLMPRNQVNSRVVGGPTKGRISNHYEVRP
jgi:hypothetical protein